MGVVRAALLPAVVFTTDNDIVHRTEERRSYRMAQPADNLADMEGV
jgi:hypothetical protein